MSAVQDQVASESTNIAVAIDANSSKLSEEQLSAWYALARACLAFASASSDSGEGPDFLRQLAGWRTTLAELGVNAPTTKWQNVPRVNPPPSKLGVWDAIRGELAGPIGLALIAYVLISRHNSR
jgi:hypothetical protein